MKSCIYCGAELPDEAKACSNCGRPLPEAETAPSGEQEAADTADDAAPAGSADNGTEGEQHADSSAEENTWHQEQPRDAWNQSSYGGELWGRPDADGQNQWNQPGTNGQNQWNQPGVNGQNQWGQPGAYGQEQWNRQDAWRYPPAQRTNGLAIASLIMGIAALFLNSLYFIPSMMAIGFGIAALLQIRKSPQYYRGGGMATAGIILGVIFLIVYIALFLWALHLMQDPEFMQLVQQYMEMMEQS